MKTCINCNNLEPDSSKFCSNCGGSYFRDEYSTNNNENVFQTNQPFLTDDSIRETNQRKKKKMFSMLGVLSLILIVLVFATAIKVTHDSKKMSDTTLTYSDTTSFSTGNINNNIYSNEWADIKFDMQDNWSEVSNQQYESYEDEITTCDFYAENSDGSQLAILLIDMSKDDTFNYTESTLIEEFSAGAASGMNNSATSEVMYQLLGNQLYLYTDITGKINGNETCITTYVRMIDDHAIVINITSNSPENNHVIAELIDSCE